MPSIFELASGCAFRDRCPHAMAVCAERVPPMFDIPAAAHPSDAPRTHAAPPPTHAAAPVAHVIASAARPRAAQPTADPAVGAALAATLAAGVEPQTAGGRHGAACWLHAEGRESPR